MRFNLRFSIVISAAVLAASASLSSQSPTSPAAAPAPTIVLDPATKYQTMTGWEASSRAGNLMPNLALVQDALLNQAVSDGVNRVRLEAYCGMENDRDLWTESLDGTLPKDLWRKNFDFINKNDNRNPNEINWNGFHFAEMDFKIDRVVNPLRERLAARGEQLFVNVEYMCARQGDRRYTHADPEEYAEFALATFLHLQEKYGWVPDSWEAVNEPEKTAFWDGDRIGRAVVAAGRRLEKAGFRPRFVLPSNIGLLSSLQYFDDAMKVKGVREFASEFSYHRYGGASEANLTRIADRGREYGIDTSMLELIGASVDELYMDLTVANVSAWAQFVIAPILGGQLSEIQNDVGGALYIIDNSNPSAPKVVVLSRTKLLRQYFKYIRRGAVRIGASSTNPVLAPVAFVNADGGTVVVVRARGDARFTVGGLPPATYGIKYATTREWDIDRPDIVVSSDGVLTTSIPESGVLTIYRR